MHLARSVGAPRAAAAAAIAAAARPRCRAPSLRPHRAPRAAAARAPRAALDPEALTDRGVPVSALQAQLEAAIEAEDYASAAQLRDEIERRRFDRRAGVEEANDAFYTAFSAGSTSGMAAAWGVGDHVQCVHPGAGCIAGREAVLQSWRMILGAGRVRVTLEDVRIAAGEEQAFVTCVEVVEADESTGRVLATNVFERQGGRWKLVHHHASPLPRSLL